MRPSRRTNCTNALQCYSLRPSGAPSAARARGRRATCAKGETRSPARVGAVGAQGHGRRRERGAGGWARLPGTSAGGAGAGDSGHDVQRVRAVRRVCAQALAARPARLHGDAGPRERALLAAAAQRRRRCARCAVPSACHARRVGADAKAFAAPVPPRSAARAAVEECGFDVRVCSEGAPAASGESEGPCASEAPRKIEARLRAVAQSLPACAARRVSPLLLPRRLTRAALARRSCLCRTCGAASACTGCRRR